jgi:hypothetical protein
LISSVSLSRSPLSHSTYSLPFSLTRSSLTPSTHSLAVSISQSPLFLISAKKWLDLSTFLCRWCISPGQVYDWCLPSMICHSFQYGCLRLRERWRNIPTRLRDSWQVVDGGTINATRQKPDDRIVAYILCNLCCWRKEQSQKERKRERERQSQKGNFFLTIWVSLIVWFTLRFFFSYCMSLSLYKQVLLLLFFLLLCVILLVFVVWQCEDDWFRFYYIWAWYFWRWVSFFELDWTY